MSPQDIIDDFGIAYEENGIEYIKYAIDYLDRAGAMYTVLDNGNIVFANF
jgi:hypothetical protein